MREEEKQIQRKVRRREKLVETVTAHSSELDSKPSCSLNPHWDYVVLPGIGAGMARLLWTVNKQ